MTRLWPRAAALVALMLAACGQASVPPPPAAAELLAQARALRAELEPTERRLVELCLRRAGHAVTLPVPPHPGSWTVAEAAARGYDRWILPSPDPELPAGALRAYLGPDDERVQVQVDGTRLSVRTGGCLGAARRQLYHRLDLYAAGVEVSDNLSGYAPGGPETTAAWQAADRRWAACMSRRGYAFGSPEAARARWQHSRRSRSPSDQEIRQAVADARCWGETSLSAERDAASRTWADRAGQRFAPLLDDFVRLLRSARDASHR